MHELSIATALMDLVRTRRAEHDGGAVRSVRIAIGELASVDPTSLALAWRDLAGDAGPLSVEWCPARQVCASCGEIAERQPGSWLRLCPTCGDPLRVEGGDELDLVEVVFEDEHGALTC